MRLLLAFVILFSALASRAEDTCHLEAEFKIERQDRDGTAEQEVVHFWIVHQSSSTSDPERPPFMDIVEGSFDFLRAMKKALEMEDLGICKLDMSRSASLYGRSCRIKIEAISERTATAYFNLEILNSPAKRLIHLASREDLTETILLAKAHGLCRNLPNPKPLRP